MNKWKEYTNEAGRRYYFNPLTAESCWELPKGGELIPTEDEKSPRKDITDLDLNTTIHHVSI